MPKESKLPGKLGEIARTLGTPEAAKRLGVAQSTMHRYVKNPTRCPDGWYEKVNSLYLEVCK